MAGLLRLFSSPACRHIFPTTCSMLTPAMQRAASGLSQDDLRREVNKAMYRAKQRGLLELDLVIGIYAERNVPTMSVDKLAETERLLREENVDLWQWLTQQSTAPDHVQENVVFKELAQSVEDIYSTKCPREARASSDAQWVHGWQDKPNTTV